MLISAEHLSINFGSRQLLDDVDFYLYAYRLNAAEHKILC